MLGGCSGDVPYLLKPSIKLSLSKPTGITLPVCRFSIASGLPLHEDKLHVVFYNGIGLVRFAEELRAVGNLIRGVGDLVPDNRIEIIKPDATANNRDVGMEGKNEMTAKAPACDTYIAHYANQTSSRSKDAEYMTPYFFQFGKKRLIVLDVTELVRVFVVALQVPIRRRRHN
jgi:hypothetical protein